MRNFCAAVILGLGFALAGTAYAEDSNDSSDTDNLGVSEAEELNDAASDAGQKHKWNPGGWAIDQATKANKKLFGDGSKKEDESD